MANDTFSKEGDKIILHSGAGGDYEVLQCLPNGFVLRNLKKSQPWTPDLPPKVFEDLKQKYDRLIAA